MLDTILLEERIEMSGLKKSYLAEKCGLSRVAFWNKVRGRGYFNAREIKILCKELGITKLTEKERIFFANEVPKNGD